MLGVSNVIINGIVPYLFVVGRIMSSHPRKDVRSLRPETCEYVKLQSKGELRLQMELRLLANQLTSRWGVYLAGSNIKS